MESPFSALEAIMAFCTFAQAAMVWRRSQIDKQLEEKIRYLILENNSILIDKLSEKFMDREVIDTSLNCHDHRIKRNSQQIAMVIGVLADRGWLHKNSGRDGLQGAQ